MAHIIYDFKGIGRTRIPVEVRGYDELTSTFIVVNEERKISTQRSRIHLQLEDDHKSELRDAHAQTIFYRSESIQYLRVARLIQNELLKRYPHIALTEDTREKIHARIGYDLTQSK